MSADPQGIELQIDADPRLAAAAGGAARFFAEAAGLTSEESTELQKSVIAACEQVFEHLTGDGSHAKVALTRYADRIEVSLAHEGSGAPAIGLDQIAGFAGLVGGSAAMNGVDRVQYESTGGLAVTRLTKYLGPGARIA